MNIPFRVKLLTETAKAPTQENPGDLWDIYAADFCDLNLKDVINHLYTNAHFQTVNVNHFKSPTDEHGIVLNPQGRILVKTGIAIELPIIADGYSSKRHPTGVYSPTKSGYIFQNDFVEVDKISAYVVADIRPRSGLALKHGITVLNTPGTIDNSYRKEIGVILYNAGHEPYTIKRGDKIAQMLIRPLYPSQMEIVQHFEDTGRGGFGSTGV